LERRGGVGVEGILADVADEHVVVLVHLPQQQLFRGQIEALESRPVRGFGGLGIDFVVTVARVFLRL